MFDIKLDQLFSKYFKFEPPANTSLNPILCFKFPIWSNAQLSQLSYELNLIKSQLDNKNLEEWSKHTYFTDLSSFLLNYLKQKKSKKNFINRGWIKMHEIISSYNVFSSLDDENELSVLFLCEIPGGFVDCVNNYIKAKYSNINLKWQAISFNPYYEQLNKLNEPLFDDRFLRQPKVYDYWCFGDDNTGDILSPHFLKWFLSRYSSQKFDLITGDAGINCIDYPHLQEKLILPLLLTQIICAINCLKEDGSLVIKFFSLFECQTLCLVYLLFNLFHQLFAFKPMSSKAGNSEVYFVCLHFSSSNKQFIQKLTHFVVSKIENRQSLNDLLSTYSLFDESMIPSYFLNQFINCSKFFKECQESAIFNNLKLFDCEKRNKAYHSLIPMKKKIIEMFYQKFSLGLITNDHFENSIYKMTNFEWIINLSEITKMIIGTSFNERGSNVRKINKNLLKKVIEAYNLNDLDQKFIKWRKVQDFIFFESDLNPIKGKAYHKINNSPFIDIHLLNFFYCLFPQSFYFQKQNVMNAKFNQYVICRGTRFVELLFREMLWEPTQVSIIGIETSPIFEICVSITRLITSKKPCIIKNVDQLKNKSSPKLFIFDPIYQAALENKCDKQSIFFKTNNERDLLSLLFTSFVNIIPKLEYKDVVIIGTEFILTRLMVGFLFLLSGLFKYLAIIPFFVIQNTENSLHSQHGQLVLFSNLETEIQKEKFDLKHLLNYVQIALQEQTKEDEMLLEIIKTPTLLSDSNFFNTIYIGNMVHLLEKIKNGLTCDL